MATVYVNGVIGDDNRTYAEAQNPATPWKTIGRSTLTSHPGGVTANGDTIVVQSGFYLEMFWVLGAQSGKTWVSDGYVEVIDSRSPDPNDTVALVAFGPNTLDNVIDGFHFRSDVRYAGLSGTNNIFRNCFFLPFARGSDGPHLGVAPGLDEIATSSASTNCALQSCVVKASGSFTFGGFRAAIAIHGGTTTSAAIHDCTIICTTRSAIITQNGWNNSVLLDARRNIIVGNGTASADGAIINFAASGGFVGRWSGDDNLYHDLNNPTPPSPAIATDGDSTYSLAAFKSAIAPHEDLSGEGDPLLANVTENAYVLKPGSPALSADGVTKSRGALNRGFVVAHSDTPSRWGGVDPTFPDGNAGFVNPGTDDRIELKTGSSGQIQRSGAGEGAPAGFGIKRIGWEEEINLTFDGAQNDAVHDRTPHVAGSPNPIDVGVEVNSGAATGAYTNIERGVELASPLAGPNVHIELVARNDYKVD